MENRLFLTELSLFLYDYPNGKTNVLSFGAPFAYFAVILSGNAELIAEDGKTVLSVHEGELFYIPKGCRYISRWYGSPTCRFYSLRFLFRSGEENGHYSLQKLLSPGLDPAQTFAALAEEKNEAEKLSAFYRLYSVLSAQMEPAPVPASRPSIHAALDRLEAEQNLPCDVPTLAKLCCMSEANFYRVFRAETGQTPVGYKNQIRCRRAAAMLATTDRTVEEVADAVGCATAAYLRRLFRQTLGQTPTQVRKKAREV